MFNVELFKKRLKTKVISNKIIYKPSTNSTNYDAWEMFEKHKQENIVIIANEQLRGKGRGEKKWFSKINKSIICSFIVKEKFSKEKIGLHSILIPIGIITGMQKIINEKFSIKWPNDVFLNNKKICGILIETKKINEILYFNIGIGINVNEDKKDFPKEIKASATSLKIESNHEIQRELLLASVLNDIDKLFINQNEKIIIKTWMENCNHVNEEIFISHNEKIINGNFKKINDKGQAIVNYNNKDIVFNGAILN